MRLTQFRVILRSTGATSTKSGKTFSMMRQ